MPMSRLVVLSLGHGNLHDGFPSVTAQLGEAENPYQMKFTASLPAAPEIIEIYRNWQALYCAFYQRLNFRHAIVDDDFEIEEVYITNVSEIELHELCQQLSKKINAWLNSIKFRKIDQQLRTQIQPSEEISFIIETNDKLLRKLPWHLWCFFDDYPKVEVALSALDYQKPKKLSTNNRRDKSRDALTERLHGVRILAILGNSEGIDISQDRIFLENLSNWGEIKFLVEPNLETFNDMLWQKSWDILFFAGHSSSKEKGCIQLNQTQTINLEQLKYALKQAISRGLSLAIFNSCDGLGLAQQLQELQIAQVIVMRSPVPDVVAQEFLKYFLAEFSAGQSLYGAVRYARERLQGLEGEYPCATWLPVICQNPAEIPKWLLKQTTTVRVNEASSLIKSAAMDTVGKSRLPQLAMRNTAQNSGFEPLPITTKGNQSKRHRSITNKHPFQTLLIVSVLIATVVMGVRYLGMLQPWELQAYDHLMQMRVASEKPDPRLFMVTIDEADIQYQTQQKMKMRWSVSDQALDQLLQKLEQYQPSTIGIDIYHDFPLDANYPALATRLQQDKRLFAVCKVSAPNDGAPDGIWAPHQIPQERLSFSDFVADKDGISRRQLLHLNPPLKSPCAAEYAFSYQIARHYLNLLGIKSQINQFGNLQIGNVVFKQLNSHSGGYQGEDASGYQVLLNYRSMPSVQKIAPQIPLREILRDHNPELLKLVKNRIVLIGVTAKNTSDYWQTPHQKQVPGVFLQAQMVSQILSAVIDRRPLLWWWSGWMEALWVWSWSLLGGMMAWRIRQPFYLGLSITILLLMLFMICCGIFTQAGWIPLVPSALTLVSGAMLLKLLPQTVVSNSKKRLHSQLWAEISCFKSR